MSRDVKKALEIALDAQHPRRLHQELARTGYAAGGLSSPMDIAHDAPYTEKSVMSSPKGVTSSPMDIATMTPYSAKGIDLPAGDKIAAPKGGMKMKGLKPAKVRVRKPRVVKPHKVRFDKGGSAPMSDALKIAAKAMTDLDKDMPADGGVSSSQGSSSVVVKKKEPGERAQTIYEKHEQTPPMRFAYGPRHGSSALKDIGFYGPISTGGRDVASEYSMDDDIGQYPSVAADMPERLKTQALNAARFHANVPREAADFAYDKARERLGQGRSPFYEPGRDPYPAWSPDQNWEKPYGLHEDVRNALRLARAGGGRNNSGVIDPNFPKSSRDYGADVKQWRTEQGRRGHKKNYDPWRDPENKYTFPTEENHDPKDPMYYIAPEEYHQGNQGRGVYALANGGRAGMNLGGNPDAVLTAGNPAVTSPVPTTNQPTPDADPTRNYVQSLYQNIMGRQGEQGGVDYWTNQLNQGNISQPEALQQFAKSQEFGNLYNQDPTKAVTSLYQTALGRAPEQGGLDYWTQQARNGMDLGQMVSGFTGSAEGQNVQNINQAYQDYLGNVPTNTQLQQAQQIFAGGGNYDDFIQKAFGDGITEQGTQVAGPSMLPGGVSIGSVPQRLYDRAKDVWDTGSQQLKDWMPGLIGQEGGPAGWNAKAKTSSAQGPFQFITGTWNDQFAKLFGEELGIKASDLGHYTKRGGYVPTDLGKQVAALRGDTSPEGKALTMAMGLGFNQANAQKLQDAGLPLTPENIYSVHFSGGTKLAEAAARNPNTPVSAVLDRRALAANKAYAGKTVGQVMNQMRGYVTSADKVQMGNNVISGYQQARGINQPDQTTTADPALALNADKAAWEKMRDDYVARLVSQGKPITLPPELTKYTPGAGGTMPSTTGGSIGKDVNLGTTLPSTGAGGNVTGGPATQFPTFVMPSTTVPSGIPNNPGLDIPTWTPQQTGVAPAEVSQIPYNAGAIYDPFTGQTTSIPWDPMTGIGIYSPAYLGPGKYDLGLLPSNGPSISGAVQPFYGYKHGGAIKDALDLAKRKFRK